MLEMVNASYTFDELIEDSKKNPERKWYYDYSITRKQYDELLDIATELYSKKLRIGKKLAVGYAHFFLANYAYYVKD